MLLREFYDTVILSEEQCVEFLRENQRLVQAADHPPCARCGHVMEQKRKPDRGGEFRLVLRCPQRGCQTTRSVRQEMPSSIILTSMASSIHNFHYVESSN